MSDLKDGSIKSQLEIFGDALSEAFNSDQPNSTTWMKAFALLTQAINLTKKYTRSYNASKLYFKSKPSVTNRSSGA